MTRSRERVHDAWEEDRRYRPRRMPLVFTIAGVLMIYALTWLVR